jgi:hypothetical protein
MLERPRHPCFAEDTERCVRSDDSRAERLHRNLAPKRILGREVDDSHSPFAQRVVEIDPPAQRRAQRPQLVERRNRTGRRGERRLNRGRRVLHERTGDLGLRGEHGVTRVQSVGKSRVFHRLVGHRKPP